MFVSASLQAMVSSVLPGIRDADKVYLVDHRLSSLDWEEDVDMTSKVRYSYLNITHSDCYPFVRINHTECVYGMKSYSLAAALSAAKTPGDQAFVKLIKSTLIELLDQTEYTFSEEPFICPNGTIVNAVWCFTKSK